MSRELVVSREVRLRELGRRREKLRRRLGELNSETEKLGKLEEELRSIEGELGKEGTTKASLEELRSKQVR
ncbi:hypothetical protein Vsou_21470 [Vulcanisaeta souniana JCM 11219]|uniref:Uncharacterized protein n=2 Tax=Vulcanisaeta souniana TaxID=164452 RepID=A0A830ELK0_9CREN|nr:hypothetical protein Vsou_21470 [Vulcanisaeta souniana JCM 11219]GGI83240.1 hypothetical protein GCM10007112_20070 [Vulcanisaeta souniana JCM 11219]